MVEVAVTKMSSKGQIVIPREMRDDIDEGEKLLIIKTPTQLLLKKASDLDEQFLEDLEFAQRTEEALREWEKSPKKRMTKAQFLKEIEQW